MWFVRVWLPIAIATTLLCALLYAVMLQSYRQSFNDPQIRMAEDAAAALQAGADPVEVIPDGPIMNIAQSIGPWIAVYDATGTSLESNAELDGEPARPPQSFFDPNTWDASNSAMSGAEVRVTWEPRTELRQALVIVRADDLFVVAGRNMREVEERIWQMEIMIAIGWFVTLLATLFAVWVSSYVRDFITVARD